jgi:ketosteroid isomerase-like protein
MSAKTAKEILKEFYEKESIYLSPEGGDFSIMEALLDAECVMYQSASLPYGGDWKGPEGFKAWMQAFSAAWTKLDVLEAEVFDAGDVAFSKIKVRAVARASGKQIDFDVLQSVKCANGKIVEFRPYYWDVPALLDVLR